MPNTLETSSQATKSSRLLIGRVELGSARRWVRSVLSQEKVTSSLKTLLWVIPLTLLIWVYAEREQVYKTPLSIPIPISVTSDDPRMVVTLLRPLDGMIMADLEGPRSQIDAVSQQVSGGGVEAVKVLVDKMAKGVREIPTAAAVKNDPMFGLRGISVTNCQPPVLQVYVDELEERELALEVPPSVTNLAAAPLFDPPKIRVRAPKRAWEKVPGETPLRAYADLASVAELDRPGPRQLAAVRVYVPALQDEQHVTLSPGTARVALEVRQADRQLKLPSMVVFPSGPAFLLKQYRVECDDVITNVNVVGPPDKIALLERPDYPKPWALVQFRREDAGAVRRKGWRPMDLPEGVKVLPEDLQREIEFKLVPITPE